MVLSSGGGIEGLNYLKPIRKPSSSYTMRAQCGNLSHVSWFSTLCPVGVCQQEFPDRICVLCGCLGRVYGASLL